MKTKSTFITTLIILFLANLIFWQLRQFRINKEFKDESTKQELKSGLMSVAVELRKKEIDDNEFSKSKELQNKFLDTAIKEKLGRGLNIRWEIKEESKDSLSTSYDFSVNNDEELLFSTCLSCLINIELMDKKNGERSFMINHTPAQIVGIRGVKKLEYLNVYILKEKSDYMSYIIPSFFLVGLIVLFSLLIFLNAKQLKLIQQKNEFVNHLSHQFQTPLASIKMSSNLLASSKDVNSEELVRIIQTESNRLENHIRTVLHWVKSDADRLTIRKTKVGLSDVVEKSIRQIKPIFIGHNAAIDFLPPLEEYFIEVDENHLQLMLFNIWENAIKHNEKQISIKVRIEKHEEHIQIISTDDGRGISEKPSQLKYKGLGLTYIDTLMKKHDGFTTIKNEKPKGLSILLNFPMT